MASAPSCPPWWRCAANSPSPIWRWKTPEAATPATVTRLGQLHRHSEAAVDQVLREVARRPVVDARSALAILRPADQRYRAMFARVTAAARKPREQRDPNLLADWKSVTTLVSRQLAVQSAFLGEHIAGADPSIDHMMKINNNAWSMLLDAGRDRGFMQTAVIDNRAPALDTAAVPGRDQGKNRCPLGRSRNRGEASLHARTAQGGDCECPEGLFHRLSRHARGDPDAADGGAGTFHLRQGFCRGTPIPAWPACWRFRLPH